MKLSVAIGTYDDALFHFCEEAGSHSLCQGSHSGLLLSRVTVMEIQTIRVVHATVFTAQACLELFISKSIAFSLLRTQLPNLLWILLEVAVIRR